MKRIIPMVILLILNFVLVQTSWTENLSERKWTISGNYPGEVLMKKGEVLVNLEKVKIAELSLYKQSKPKTTGHPVVVTFKTDSIGMGKTYSLYIYQDQWTLRKAAVMGFGTSEIAVGDTAPLNKLTQTGVQARLKSSYFDTSIQTAQSAKQ